jgi:5-methyltetrahydrofolate--homocysteine methyltransferase
VTTATQRGTPFIVIGENIHATRVVRRDGPKVVSEGGRVAIRFAALDGTQRLLPIAEPIAAGSEFASGKVKHVRNALLLGMGADGSASADVTGRVTSAEGALARDYLVALARRQVDAGAAYLDANVDELSANPELRSAALAWLVRLLEPLVSVPLALDSSSAEVLASGLEASTRPRGAPLLNSASLERLDILDLAAAEACPVVLSAVGADGMPSNATKRIDNAARIVAEAAARGLAVNALFIDPLVIPVAVDPEAGHEYLDAVLAIRSAHGESIHITGGLSNVSFGLPARRLLNDVFVALAAEAGADSGIVDPVATDLARVFALERTSEAARLAEAVLTGADPFGGEFLAAFRDGRLSTAGS